MAGHHVAIWGLFSWPIVPLLVAQIALVFSASTAQRAASSILAATNGTVPDYVTRHAPLVWLHSQDPFRPSDLLAHVRHTTPTVGQEPVPDLPELNLDNLAQLNHLGTGPVALTSNDDVTTLPAWLLGDAPDASGSISNATPCVVILVEKSPRDIDAFYFYFYSYNRGGNITQVLEPLKSLLEGTEDGLHFGDHVGDWEHNMVRFRDGKPLGIYYSQHTDGTAYDWDDAALSTKDGRPLVFSAYGSHANYESEGDHVHDSVMVDRCDAGQLWDPVLSAYFYHLDPASFTLKHLPSSDPAVPTESNLTSFLYFTGIWGDAQYPDSHPHQKTVRYFGMKRFVSGPQGPIVKHLVRKGLSPDHGEPKSWLQWGVGVLMAWYPCCLRGWRVWMSGAVVITCIVLMVLAVRHGVRRYRMKGYKKVDTEIPLDDLDAREDGIEYRADASRI